MISHSSGYVIVDKHFNILLYTIASNRHDAWDKLIEPTHWLTKKEALRLGFKCVRVEVETEEI